MPVKAIVDIEVNDAELKAALATFEKIKKTVSLTPNLGGGRAPGSGGGGAPVKVPGGGPTPSTPGAGGNSPAVQQAMNVFILMSGTEKKAKEIVPLTVKFAAASKQTASAWAAIGHSSKLFGDNIRGAANTALSFASRLGITAAIGATIGIGGSLFGLDRLAGAASAGRRSSSGLGLSYGQQQAFGITYGRLLDAGSFLGGISGARGNIASPQAGALYSLGMDPSRGGNTSQQATEALQRIRQLTLRTPEHMLGTLLQTHRLGELGMDTETLRRIRGLSPEEFNQYQQEHTQRVGQFGVSDKNMKGWQDLNVALIAAGQKIQSVLIEGLAPLARPLTQLSEAFSEVVRNMLGSQGFKDLLESATQGLRDFANYVTTPKFMADIRAFGTAIGVLADKTVSVARFLGLIPTPLAPGQQSMHDSQMQKFGRTPGGPIKRNWFGQLINDFWTGGKGGATPKTLPDGTPIIDTSAQDAAALQRRFGAAGPAGFGDRPVNNPGNLRPVGANSGFMQYASPQQGIRAMANDLLAKQRIGKDTIRDIISMYAPSSENNTGAYIKNVSDWTKFGPDQKLNLQDPATMAAIMAAMIRQEGNGKNPNYQQKVIVEVLNNTGGNAIVQSNQMGHGAQ